MSKLPAPSSFTYRGRQLGYREYGSGARVLVLTHGLLMDGRMFSMESTFGLSSSSRNCRV